MPWVQVCREGFCEVSGFLIELPTKIMRGHGSTKEWFLAEMAISGSSMI